MKTRVKHSEACTKPSSAPKNRALSRKSKDDAARKKKIHHGNNPPTPTLPSLVVIRGNARHSVNRGKVLGVKGRDIVVHQEALIIQETKVVLKSRIASRETEHGLQYNVKRGNFDELVVSREKEITP